MLLLSEILSPKGWPKKASRRPDDILTQTVKQPYGVSYLTGHVFKGVQWAKVSNIKIMSRTISSPLIPVYPNFEVVF